MLVCTTERDARDVKRWMDSSKLKLNDDETESILCGKSSGNSHLPVVDNDVTRHSLKSAAKIKNLSVMLYKHLSM